MNTEQIEIRAITEDIIDMEDLSSFIYRLNIIYKFCYFSIIQKEVRYGFPYYRLPKIEKDNRLKISNISKGSFTFYLILPLIASLYLIMVSIFDIIEKYQEGYFPEYVLRNNIENDLINIQGLDYQTRKRLVTQIYYLIRVNIKIKRNGKNN
ncbi:MAG TPA: hypothetical protein PLI06_09230 [Methanofastidiosum sp.]|nr:hypothetical protein [Methanofastidiosum sp.]